MLRHGFVPPKESAHPESGRIAIQGVQPKGLNPDGESVTPAGKIIASMFPFYLTNKSIGGRKRATPLDPDTLTPDDLYACILDVRRNGDSIYRVPTKSTRTVRISSKRYVQLGSIRRATQSKKSKSSLLRTSNPRWLLPTKKPLMNICIRTRPRLKKNWRLPKRSWRIT